MCIKEARNWWWPSWRAILPMMAMCLALPNMAWGQTEMPWQYRAKTELKPGEQAEFIFVAKQDIRSVGVRVLPIKGPAIQVWSDKFLDAGEEKILRWPVPKGRSNWRIEVEVGESQALLTATVELQVVMATALDVTLVKEDVDFTKGQVVIETSKPLANVQVRYVTEKNPDTQKAELEPPQKSGRITLPLPHIGEDRFRLLLFKFKDQSGQWVKVRLVNWYARIPHQDVVFPSGSAVISPAEHQKLLGVIDYIKKEQRAFAEAMGDQNATLDLELYIAGMTDTVGSAADNLILSAERAKSIAAAFRRQNLRCPIRSAGFGESRLKVVTPDNVPEARNRRAVYILTNHPPRDLVPPRGRWRLSP